MNNVFAGDELYGPPAPRLVDPDYFAGRYLLIASRLTSFESNADTTVDDLIFFVQLRGTLGTFVPQRVRL